VAPLSEARQLETLLQLQRDLALEVGLLGAVRSGAPQLHADSPGNICAEWTLRTGDVDAAFQQAEVVVRERLLHISVRRRYDPDVDFDLLLAAQTPDDSRLEST